MGHDGLKSQPEMSGQLARQLEALDERLSDAAAVTGRTRSLSWLDTRSAEVSARTARLLTGPLTGVLRAYAAYRSLRLVDGPAVPDAGAHDESEAALYATVGPERRRTLLHVGLNARTEGVVLFGMVSQELQLLPGVLTRLDVAVNETAEETAVLRLLGTRHRLSASLSVEQVSGNYGLLVLSGRRYQTRIAELLGAGGSADLELGHRFRFGQQELRLRASTSWGVNQVEGRPPDAVAAFLPGGTLAPEPFLPPWLGSAWVGVTLTNGDLAELGGSAWRYTVDLAGGWLMPARQLGYQVRLSAAAPLVAGAQLSGGVSLINALDGVPARSADLTLSYRF
jgi:hypothetical protein